MKTQMPEKAFALTELYYSNTVHSVSNTVHSVSWQVSSQAYTIKTLFNLHNQTFDKTSQQPLWVWGSSLLNTSSHSFTHNLQKQEASACFELWIKSLTFRAAGMCRLLSAARGGFGWDTM